MSEKLYDEVIAPKLAEIGKLCQDNGLSLVASVEYAPGEFGRTTVLAQGSHFAIRLVDAAIRSHGNVDTLFIALSKYAREHGHGSLVLERLGINSAPSSTTDASK